LKVLAAVALLLLLVVSSLSMCAYKLYNTFDDFPEQAQVENLNQRYAQLVADLNTSIESSDSAFSLASLLEKINYPTETLFVEMQIDKLEHPDEQDLLIIDNRKAGTSSNLKVVMNGAGYGRTGDQHYWILQHPVNKYGYEHIQLFFERDAPSLQ